MDEPVVALPAATLRVARVSRAADRALPRPVLVALALALVGPATAPVTVLASAVLEPSAVAALPSVLGTGLYLPAYLLLVLAAARGERARHGGLLLLTVTAVVIAVTAWSGAPWLSAYASVALSALVVLPLRWAALAVALLMAAQLPLAAALGTPSEALIGILMISKSLAMYAFLRLTAAAQQLESERALLAEQAVVQERLRVGEELSRTIVVGLEDLTERGRALSELPDARGLEELVELSRRTLAGARQVLRAYQVRSLRSELATAAALLQAAGVRTSIFCPENLPEAAGAAEAAAQLRAATVRMLRDGRTRSCRLVVVRDGDAVRLDVHASVDPNADSSGQQAGAA